jgi:enoyl-CoA hydratase/carnithine racemase
MSDVVLAERRGPLGVIVLNRPDVLNAIDGDVMRCFGEELGAFGADPAVRVVIITGRGRAFSTGADIRAIHGGSAAERDDFMRRAHEMMNGIEATPKPVIAAVNGIAAGGGFEMMLACDLSIAAESARIGLTEIRYGFLPGGGGTQRLPRWVPPPVAKRLLWSGELLTAEQALELGLVATVVTDVEVMAEAERVALQLAERSPAALAEAKTLVSAARERPLREGLLAERAANVRLLSSPEAIAGIEGFLKRGSGR